MIVDCPYCNEEVDIDDSNLEYLNNENYIEDPLKEDRFLIIRVLVYNNKVIFRYDANDIEFVMCKNRGDAIRFYNLLLKIHEKNKRIVFTGRVITRSELGASIIQLIQDKTGWKRNVYIRLDDIRQIDTISSKVFANYWITNKEHISIVEVGGKNKKCFTI